MKQQYKNTSYIIYDDGRCYSLLSNKFLTPKNTVKYPTYHLVIDNKKKTVMVHRMVAETFLPNPENKPIVNHLDGNTHNYNLNNLEWATAKENSLHAVNNGLTNGGDQTINRYTENLLNEEWKPVKDFPLYVISSHGRIMNINTKRLLKSYADNSGGYLCVSLWKNGKGKTARIHQLVYATFYDDYELNGFVINHKDGNKQNNYKDNLEKITYKENNIHAVYTIKTNNITKAVNQLNKEREIISSYPSIAEAQRRTGINNINRAIRKHGSAGGYFWEYKE